LRTLANSARSQTIPPSACAYHFPAEWERFRAGVPAADRDGDLVAAFARLMEDRRPPWPCGRENLLLTFH
jgi:hypothetical protein